MPFKKFEDPRVFGKLFGNIRFKQSYSNHINTLMQRLYQPGGNWGRLLGVEGNRGVINTNYPLNKAFIYLERSGEPLIDEIKEFYTDIHDLTDPKWSLLNYVNTHWTSFMHIVNTINYWISTGQIKNQLPFTFDNDYFNELDRLKTILNNQGQYIFMPHDNLNCFHKIMGAIARSTYIGNLGENKTLESLTELGNVSDVIKSRPGERVDTHGGVDIRFKLNGMNKTLQCKSFTRMFERDGEYVFSDISNSGYYNVDFFSFVNRREIYVFDTANDGLKYKFNDRTQSYIFDRSLLKYKIKI